VKVGRTIQLAQGAIGLVVAQQIINASDLVERLLNRIGDIVGRPIIDHDFEDRAHDVLLFVDQAGRI
jgi:hypothetical protein